MPEGVQTYAASFSSDVQFIQYRVQNRLHHLVATVRTSPPIHKHKFVRVIDEMLLELCLHRFRHGDAVFGLRCFHGLNLSVPSRLSDVNLTVLEIQVLDTKT